MKNIWNNLSYHVFIPFMLSHIQNQIKKVGLLSNFFYDFKYNNMDYALKLYIGSTKK